MSEGSLAGTLVRLVLSLTTVLTLMVFLARYLRHRQNGGSLGKMAARGRKTTPPLQVLTRQGLSRGSSVAVVRVSGQLLLLGVTESTVSLLGELKDDEEPDPAPDPARTDLVASTPAPTLADLRHVVVTVVENLRQRTVRHG
jgi:flagellar protein FliO/FliZ